MDLNKSFLIGRLTRDAETGYLTNGTCMSKFTIAVNRMKGKDGRETADFFDVKVFGKQAEVISKYLGKGKQVAVDGRLQQERWEKDGQKFSKVVINAESVQLLGGSKTGIDQVSAYEDNDNPFN